MRVILLSLALAGCAGLPEVPRETKIPVSVPCIEVLPTMPILVTDAQLLAMPDSAFVLALAADRLERQKYMAITAALLQACLR